LAHLLHSASEHAVIFLNGEGRIVAWLGAAERLFGYSKSEAIGLKFAELFTQDDRRLQMDLQELAVARAIGRSEDERWHVRKDGTLFWASGVLAAVKDLNGGIQAFCKVMRDRTDLRQQLDTLQNRVWALQQENERRSRILESLSHQLQGLAGPLRDASEVFETSEASALQGRELAARTRQLEAMSSMLEETAKAETSTAVKPHVGTNAVDLQEALRGSIASVRPRVLAGGQHLNLTVPAATLRVRADPTDIQTMLHHLLANALERTPSGGNIHVTASVEARSAVIRITDDGAGIPGKRLARIFVLLTGSDGRAAVHASEAGLAAVRDLAAAYDGSLEARSPGKGMGSVFTLRLPLMLE
jgi:PAS domain S-box-containing protein